MSPELKYFGGNSHCQRPECREEEGALLPRSVFAQSRNTRLLASGMCSERAAFIHCLAPKQTDRYHRTKVCRATCLHPRYEVHHPAKTFASWRKSLQGYGPGPRCVLPSSHEASRSKRTAASRFEADMYGYFSLRGPRARTGTRMSPGSRWCFSACRVYGIE